jgi:hypothetical protein
MVWRGRKSTRQLDIIPDDEAPPIANAIPGSTSQ